MKLSSALILLMLVASITSSLLSGSNLALCTRYAVATRGVLRWNLPYAVVGWLACGLVLATHAWLT